MHIDNILTQPELWLDTNVEIEGVFIQHDLPGNEHSCYLATSSNVGHFDINTITLDFSRSEINRVAPLYAIRVPNQTQLLSHQAQATVTGLLQKSENKQLKLNQITKLTFVLPHSTFGQMYLDAMGLSSKSYQYESTIKYGKFATEYGSSRGKVNTSWSIQLAPIPDEGLQVIVSEALYDNSFEVLFDKFVSVEGILFMGSVDPEPPHSRRLHLGPYGDYDDVSHVDIKHSIPIKWRFAEAFVSEVAPKRQSVPYLNPARFTGYLRRSTIPGYIAELTDVQAFTVIRESFL